MTLEQQVCNLEIAKRLKELGVKQRGVLFAHFFNAGEPTGAIVDATMYDSMDDDYWKAKLVSAFTVAELGEMLPDGFSVKKMIDARFGNYYCYVKIGKSAPFLEGAETEADARAKMLIFLIQNNLLKVAPNQPSPNA